MPPPPTPTPAPSAPVNPLARQRTPESLLSYWSDRNPPGATISIYAIAKPLMKLMYHQQAWAFIKENRGKALTKEMLEVYSSYLTYKYISPATRTAVLGELADRAKKFDGDDARTTLAVESPTIFDMPEQVKSTDIAL